MVDDVAADLFAFPHAGKYPTYEVAPKVAGYCSSRACTGSPVHRGVVKTHDKRLEECPDCKMLLVWRRVKNAQR